MSTGHIKWTAPKGPFTYYVQWTKVGGASAFLDIAPQAIFFLDIGFLGHYLVENRRGVGVHLGLFFGHSAAGEKKIGHRWGGVRKCFVHWT